MSTPKDHCDDDVRQTGVRATEAPWEDVTIPWETYPPDWDDDSPSVTENISFNMNVSDGGQVGVRYQNEVSMSFTHSMASRTEQIFLVDDCYFNTHYTIESIPTLLWEEEQGVVTQWKTVDYPN